MRYRTQTNILHSRNGNEYGYSQEGKEVFDARCYLPGDMVTCLIGGEIPHVMIVSDRKSPDGVPLVIHNVGSGTQEENRLFSYDITGHHRLRMAK